MTPISYPAPKDQRNADRPVLVLGARSDIARALAHALAARGHPLQLAARDADDLGADRDDYALRYDVPVTLHSLDITKPDSFDAMIAGLPTQPRIVISAVGLMGDQDSNAADPDLAMQVFATNFTGPSLFCENIARRMDAAETPAALIGISSVAGDRGRARNYVYGASKAGFSAYLSGLRQKYASRPLLVMTVRPGFVATSMTEGMDLPAKLTTTPEALASRIIRALDKGRPVHVDLLWRVIMGIITHLPERIFMRLKF